MCVCVCALKFGIIITSFHFVVFLFSVVVCCCCGCCCCSYLACLLHVGAAREIALHCSFLASGGHSSGTLELSVQTVQRLWQSPTQAQSVNLKASGVYVEVFRPST